MIVLILILFIGGKIYLKQHKKQVISLIETEAKKQLNGGDLHITDINISFYNSFPRFAFTIDSLTLRDSLWYRHHHDLIFASRVYATMDLFKLIFGKISIDRVKLESPHIYLYTDTSGYSNTSLFNKKAPPKNNKAKNFEYPILQLSNGNLVVEKKDNNKIFAFDIPSLETRISTSEEDPGLKIDVALNCKIRQLIFNQQKGPYLEGKTVTGRVKIEFNKNSKVLQFTKIKLVVDQQPFIFSGKFFLAEVPAPFTLSWETENLSFRKAASFLSNNILPGG